jgi:sugar phosphate isomerase/epimerase
MIYISSSCVKNNKIQNSVQNLLDNGFINIELSGGTEYYDGFEDDLIKLQNKYNLNYICHNYFPPPKEHFVLNLASLDDAIYNDTIEHLKSSIILSSKLGAKKFAFHAGFFIDIKVSEIGKKITKENLYDKDKAIQRFCDGYAILKKLANSLDIKLYIENNVFSKTNFETYSGENFFMLTNSSEYKELKKQIDFNILLDVAHLKVSSNTLNLSFEEELKYLINETDYVHISDNDALHDINNKLQEDSSLVQLLEQYNLKDKVFTLEIYDDLDTIKETYRILEDIINDR